MSIHQRSAPVFWIVAACIVAVFLTYSQLYAYVGDEPFHLLAAQLIRAGKRPYLDFFYQHPPLHAYLTAGLFHLSETWRISHAFSALEVSLAAVLAGLYARDLFVEERARLMAGVLTMIFFAANCYALIFATTGLPYGFCLLCSIGALFFSRPDGHRLSVFASGLFAGAAAASNLLTLPVLAIVFARVLIRDRRLVFVFIAGTAVAFTPLLVLYAQGPNQVVFNLVGYHLVDRPSLGWRFNVRQVIGWFWSVQGATLTVLAILANWLRRGSWERGLPARQSPAVVDDETRRSEAVRWCSLTALALIALIASAKTTSSFYLLLTLPFLAVLAATGAVELTHRAWSRRAAPYCSPGRQPGVFVAKGQEPRRGDRGQSLSPLQGSIGEGAAATPGIRPGLQSAAAARLWAQAIRMRSQAVIVLIAVMYLAGLSGMKYVWRWQAPYDDHRDVEMIARELEACTMGRGNYYSSEAIFFAAHRLPPPGLENRFNPHSKADELLRDGKFEAVCIGTTNPRVQEFKLLERYARIKTISLDGYSMYVLCDKCPTPVR